MLTFEEKISFLENYLIEKDVNNSDSISDDILIFFDEFNSENERLNFLKKIFSFKEIEIWIEKLISRISLKFDSESEQINDFIYDFLELG